jgi:predicted DNA-binding helix-hairpin-helix protein
MYFKTMKDSNLPEDVPADLLYMRRTYDWLYSKYGSDLQAAATEGNKQCQELMDKLNTAINTIEFWQLEGDFGRAHYEVEQMKRWFNPVMKLEY